MPAFCPLCASDDNTAEGTTDDGTRFATCRDAYHGEAGYTWEFAAPPSSGSTRGGGVGAELGIWDKLVECVPAGVDFHPYGDVENQFFERYPRDAETLLGRYGHRWRSESHRSTTPFSMSVYLSARLKELEKEGLLDVQWGPATGPWAYNGIISYWRHHSAEQGDLVTALDTAAKDSPASETPELVVDPAKDVARIAAAAADLPPAVKDYTEHDFVTNLLATVLDYQMQTSAVVKAMEHYKEHRWGDIRTIDQLEAVIDRFPADEDGNRELAGYLWGNRHWTRARQLRDLSAYFRSIGVTDQRALTRWAERATFERDFHGRVHGLGPAVFQWLVMRQGVDTVKPDVHVRRFAEAAVGRKLSDTEIVELVSAAAERLGISARELDWRIWEASRG